MSQLGVPRSRRRCSHRALRYSLAPAAERDRGPDGKVVAWKPAGLYAKIPLLDKTRFFDTRILTHRQPSRALPHLRKRTGSSDLFGSAVNDVSSDYSVWAGDGSAGPHAALQRSTTACAPSSVTARAGGRSASATRSWSERGRAKRRVKDRSAGARVRMKSVTFEEGSSRVSQDGSERKRGQRAAVNRSAESRRSAPTPRQREEILAQAYRDAQHPGGRRREARGCTRAPTRRTRIYGLPQHRGLQQS